MRLRLAQIESPSDLSSPTLRVKWGCIGEWRYISFTHTHMVFKVSSQENRKENPEQLKAAPESDLLFIDSHTMRLELSSAIHQ